MVRNILNADSPNLVETFSLIFPKRHGVSICCQTTQIGLPHYPKAECPSCLRLRSDLLSLGFFALQSYCSSYIRPDGELDPRRSVSERLWASGVDSETVEGAVAVPCEHSPETMILQMNANTNQCKLSVYPYVLHCDREPAGLQLIVFTSGFMMASKRTSCQSSSI